MSGGWVTSGLLDVEGEGEPRTGVGFRWVFVGYRRQQSEEDYGKKGENDSDAEYDSGEHAGGNG